MPHEEGHLGQRTSDASLSVLRKAMDAFNSGDLQAAAEAHGHLRRPACQDLGHRLVAGQVIHDSRRLGAGRENIEVRHRLLAATEAPRHRDGADSGRLAQMLAQHLGMNLRLGQQHPLADLRKAIQALE